jgi:hypothetical protein
MFFSETKGSCREDKGTGSRTVPMSAPVRSSPHQGKNYKKIQRISSEAEK